MCILHQHFWKSGHFFATSTKRVTVSVPVSKFTLFYEDEETQPILTIVQALTFKDSTEDELISSFISEPSSVNPEMYNHFTAILESESQQNFRTEDLSQTSAGISSKSITVEIEPGKTLNINLNLTDAKTQQLMKLLRENKELFAWDYTDMKGISS